MSASGVDMSDALETADDEKGSERAAVYY